MDKPSQVQLLQKLEMLRSEHRDLDDVIAHLVDTRPYDQLQHRSDAQVSGYGQGGDGVVRLEFVGDVRKRRQEHVQRQDGKPCQQHQC